MHATAIDQWRRILSNTEIAIAERDCGPLMDRCGYGGSQARPPGIAAEWVQRLTYLAHLGGVLLVNPRRAYVQGKALLRSRRPVQSAAAAVPQGDPPA